MRSADPRQIWSVHLFLDDIAASIDPFPWDMKKISCDCNIGVGDIIEKIIDSRYIGIFKTYRQIIVIEKNRFGNYRKIIVIENVQLISVR